MVYILAIIKSILVTKEGIILNERLFYQDAYIEEFQTRGIRQQQDQKGNTYVVLEQTAFYPTGGGQPFDTGILNGIEVVNVEEVEGEIRHFVKEPLSRLDLIKGKINWDRRFDHMQQHNGQHILTASFVELFEIVTVSFHLGREFCTIDLNTENLSDDMVLQAERRANEIILENRQIETKWVTMEEAVNYTLRKQLSVSENIRLVIIPEFDYNGCGGIHPSSTGQVQALKVLNMERQKKNIRLQFICGNRVIKQFHHKHKVLQDLNKLLSSPEQEMTVAVTRLLQNGKHQEKIIEGLKEELLEYEARELLKQSIFKNGFQVMGKVFQNRNVKELQKLAKIMVNIDAGTEVFFITESEGGLQFVCVRGAKGKLNMKSIAAQILPLINGKGGGANQQHKAAVH